MKVNYPVLGSWFFSFNFYEMLKILTKGLWFLTMTTGGYLDLLFGQVGGDIITCVEGLYLFLLTCDANAETETKFIRSIWRDFGLSFENWTTDRLWNLRCLEFQLDKRTTAKIRSPKNLISAQRTEPTGS